MSIKIQNSLKIHFFLTSFFTVINSNAAEMSKDNLEPADYTNLLSALESPSKQEDSVKTPFLESQKLQQSHTNQNDTGEKYPRGWAHFNSPAPSIRITFEYYKLSAEQGNAEAQRIFGRMYYLGDHAKQDYNEAYKWFKLAADQGDALAQEYLGDLYQYGYGVPKNDKDAYPWYKRSAEQQNSSAKSKLESLYLSFQDRFAFAVEGDQYACKYFLDRVQVIPEQFRYLHKSKAHLLTLSLYIQDLEKEFLSFVSDAIDVLPTLAKDPFWEEHMTVIKNNLSILAEHTDHLLTVPGTFITCLSLSFWEWMTLNYKPYYINYPAPLSEPYMGLSLKPDSFIRAHKQSIIKLSTLNLRQNFLTLEEKFFNYSYEALSHFNFRLLKLISQFDDINKRYESFIIGGEDYLNYLFLKSIGYDTPSFNESSENTSLA